MADDGSVFVTVGTTSFDRLIQTVSSKGVCQILKDHGYKKLQMQIGRGEYEPDLSEEDQLDVHHYRYKDSLRDDIAHADLIISHAGAGTCLEVLGAQKPLVVVINEELMGNHQTELAKKLASDGHLIYTTCRDLPNVLLNLDLSKLEAFEPGRPEKFASFLDKVMGVS